MTGPAPAAKRTVATVVAAALVCAPLLVILAPGGQGPAADVYSAAGYTQIMKRLARWLDYNSEQTPGRRVVELSSRTRNTEEVYRFYLRSFLRDDIAADNPELWVIKNGRVVGVSETAHNIALPIRRPRVWEGSLRFRKRGVFQGGLGGRNQVTLSTLERPLEESRDDIVVRDPFGRWPDASGVRIDFTPEGLGTAARVLLLGDQLFIRRDGETEIQVDGALLSNRGAYRPLPAGTFVTFLTGGTPATYVSQGVAGASSFISAFQPLSGRSRNPRMSAFASDFEGAMNEVVQRVDQTAKREGLRHDPAVTRLQRLDVASSIDADLHFEVQAELERTSRAIQNKIGEGFVAAVTVMDARTGEVVALASYPATEAQDISGRGRWRQNHNFRNYPIGSVAKPLIASAIVETWPQLTNLQVAADEPSSPRTAKPTMLLGLDIAKRIGEDEGGASGWIDFQTFLQRSSNRYASALMLLGLARRPLVEGSHPSNNAYRFGDGEARAFLPVLRVDETLRLSTPSSQLEWPRELARLYDIRSSDIETESTRVFDDPLYDKAPWTALLDNLEIPGLLERNQRLFNGVSPWRVNLGLNNARNLRGDWLTVMIGGATSRWNNVKLAESFARLTTGQRVKASLLAVSPDAEPAKSMRADAAACARRNPDGAVSADGRFCDAPRQEVLDGLSLVSGPNGTAYRQMNAALAAARAKAGGRVFGFFSKTGTPQHASIEAAVLDRAVSALGSGARPLLVYDPRSLTVRFRLNGRLYPVRNADEARAATAALNNTEEARLILEATAASAAPLVNEVLRFNTARAPAERAAILTITNGSVTGKPWVELDDDRSVRYGKVYVFLAGRYPAGSRRPEGGPDNVSIGAVPEKAYVVVVNIQARLGTKPHPYASELGARILTLLTPRLFPPVAR